MTPPIVPSAMSRRNFLQSALALGCTAAAAPVDAAAAGRVVFGFLPGPAGVPGIAALLQELQGHYQPDLGLRVDYVPGNSGALAIDAVHRGLADGGSVLLMPSSVMTLLPLLRKLPGVDPLADFKPVTPLAYGSLALAAGRVVPSSVTTLHGYMTWVRDNPTQGDYGVSGLGTMAHLIGAVLSETTGLSLKAVAYRGMPSMADDLSYGALPAALLTGDYASMLAATGKARLLAVSSATRWQHQPAVPTLRELGMLSFDAAESLGLFVSSRTPPEKIEQLATAVRLAMQAPAVATAFDRAPKRAKGLDGTSYATEIELEHGTWSRIVKDYRFSMER